MEIRLQWMLELFLEIRHKSTPLARFGTTITKKNGEEESYTPGCIRTLKNPVTGSLKVRDTDEHKEIKRDFDELLKTFKENGTNLLKRAAELEVKIRVEQLQELVIACAGELAVYWVVAECARIKLSKTDANFTMSHSAIGWKVAFDYLVTFSEGELEVLKFESLENLKSAFAKVKESKGIAVGQFVISDDDKTVYKAVKEALTYLFPKMTFDVWKSLKQDDILRTVNQDISVMDAKKDQGQLNSDTAGFITAGANAPVTQAALFEFVEKCTDKAIAKFSNKMRSNSSADQKNQGSAGEKSGPSSNRSPKESKKNSPGNSKKSKEKTAKKKSQQQKHQQKKSQKKSKKNKKKSNQQQQSRQQQQPRQQSRQQQQPNSRRAGRGNQGAAASGRGGRGNSRR